MSKYNYSDAPRMPSHSKTDVVIGGVVVRDIPAVSVLITSQADLSKLPHNEPGTIAYTAGYKGMWQLSAAGEWVDMLS